MASRTLSPVVRGSSPRYSPRRRFWATRPRSSRSRCGDSDSSKGPQRDTSIAPGSTNPASGIARPPPRSLPLLRQSDSQPLMTATSTHLAGAAAAPSGSLPRRDVLALWGGVLFSLLFTGLIWLAGERLNAIPKLPDQGYAWYFWKLPEPTFWSRATAWGGYVAHQLASWGLILYAQRRVRRYTTGLHPVNAVALAVNAGF